MKKLFKAITLAALSIIVNLFWHCQCQNNESTPIEPIKTPTAAYYNLETIDLEMQGQTDLSFVFNGKKLMLDEESGLYISEDLIVYRTKEGSWKATVIGPGGIESALEIKSQNNLTKEISIKTTSEIFPYKDELGPEWPGMYNIGNTCFANSLYKLLARSSIFDEVINQDKPKQIHTFLRNIINGIRLGKRSTLHEEAVNRKISKIFLEQLTLQSRKTWNDRSCGGDAEVLLQSIFKCFFSVNHRLLTQDQNIEAIIADVNIKNGQEYVHVTSGWHNNGAPHRYFLSQYALLRSKNTATSTQDIDISYLFSSPRSLSVRWVSEVALKNISEIIQIPIWDYKTKKQIGTKSYRTVAMAISEAGHTYSFINFNKSGWVKHDDDRIYKLPVSNIRPYLILYELQD